MMKKIYSILSVIMVLAAFSVTSSYAQGYNVQLAQQCNPTTGGTETMSFNGTFPNANGNGTLTIIYRGDLNSGSEILTFNGEAGPALGTSAFVTQCTGIDSVTYTIPMATINAWAATGNKIDISAVADNSVNAGLTGCISASSFCVTGRLSYPFATGPNDAGASTITPAILCPSTDTVKVKINNYGTNQIDSVWVNWSKNGTLQTPIHLMTLLDTVGGTGSSSATVSLGAHVFTAGSTETFKVWTSMPNGVADTTVNNDTTQASIKPSLSGTYTIGGTTPDYANFTAAVNDLVNIGVCGPVVFNVRQGTYTEQISFPVISGVSATNTITFQSDASNTAYPLLQFGNTSADNYVVRFDATTSYITLDSLNIKTTSTSTWSNVIAITGNASNITIKDCQLDGGSVTTTSNFAAVILQNGGVVQDITIEDNEINNGSYALYFRGSGTAVASRDNNVTITGNVMDNFKYYATYFYYHDGLTFDENTMTQGNTTYFSYGIYTYYCSNTNVRKNTLVMKTTSSNYGMMVGRYDGTGTSEISNNMISTSLNSTPTSSGYGIYFNYPKNVNLYHNTINVTAGGTFGRAFYVFGSTSTLYGNNNVVNNIFVNSSGGYALDIRSGANNTTFIPKMDKNIYYSSGAAPIRYANIDYATFAAYQAVSFADTNSYFGDPGFYGANNLHLQGVLAVDSGDATLGITTDIDGDVRPLAPTTGYDIGADEYIPPTCPSPTSIKTSFLTADSADITWTNGPADSSWIIEYGAAGFTPGTGTVINSSTDTVAISGLSPLVCYDVWVKSICTVGDTSILYGPFNFCTPCASYTPAYMQDFSTGMSWSTVPTCWDEAKGQLTVNSSLSYGSSNWTGDGFGNVGFTGAAQMQVNYTGRYEWLISPSIDLGTGAIPYQVEFDIAMTNFYVAAKPIGDSMAHDDKVALVISTDDGTTWSDTNVLRQWDTLDIPSHTGDYFAYNLTAAGYTGKVRLAIYGESTVTNQRNEVFIDNFNVVQVPTCPRPTTLRLDSATTTTAVVNWVNGASDVSWLLEYGAPGFTPGTAGGTVVASATNPATITGLTHSTCYDVYLRSICGVGDTSIQIGPLRLCTECAPIADFCNGFEADASASTPLCWSTFVNATTTFATVNVATFNAYNGTQCVRMQNSNDATATLMLISPELTTLSSGTHRANFWARGDTTVIMGTMTDPTNPGTFTAWDTLDNIDRTAYQNYRVNFDTYTGTDKYVAILFQPHTTYDNVYIDDFCWESIPNCEKAPAVTILNDGVDSTSLNIGWNRDTTWFTDTLKYQEKFMIVYGPAGYTPGDPSVIDSIFTTTTTAPYPPNNFTQVTGLTPLTEYCFWVKAICANGDTSHWSGPHCGSTGCPDGIKPPYFNNFADYLWSSGEQLPQCWSEAKGQLGFASNIAGPTSFWTYDGFGNVGFDGAAKMYVGGTNRFEWLVSPTFYLGTDPNVARIVEFDAALTQAFNSTAPINGFGDDDTVALVVSYDKGITWKKADILMQWDTGNMPSHTGDHIVYEMRNTTGYVTFGFYGTSNVTNETVEFFVDNFSIRDTTWVGTEEVSFNDNFKVFPNPNNGVFTVLNEGNAQQSSIKLLDVQGRLVYDNQFYFTKNGRKQVEVNNLKSGVYILLLQGEGKIEQHRIVVQ